MKNEASRRGELSAVLWSFRREFIVVGVLSLVANVLMLSPTLYMMQIYDRVMISQNQLTLLAISLIILFFFGVMTFADWLRSRLLVRAGVRFDDALNDRIFRAGFAAELEQTGHNPAQALGDLAVLRQFLTGNGTIALFDAPWTPVYIAVSFMLHPLLGWLSIAFVANLVLLAVIGQGLTAKSAKAASKAEVEVNSYVFSKLRNSEVIESMGMLRDLRRRWQTRQRKYNELNSVAQAGSQRMSAIVKFVRYTQQSLSLGAGAWLAIHGEISVGSMIAANVLMSRASQPFEAIVMGWKELLASRSAYLRLAALLTAHPARGSGSAARTPDRRSDAAGTGRDGTEPGRADPQGSQRILSGRTVCRDHRSFGLGQIHACAVHDRDLAARRRGRAARRASGHKAGIAPRSVPRSAICRRTSSSSTARSPRTSRASDKSNRSG